MSIELRDGDEHRAVTEKGGTTSLYMERKPLHETPSTSHRVLANQFHLINPVGCNLKVVDGDQFKYLTGSGTIPAAERSEIESAIKNGIIFD